MASTKKTATKKTATKKVTKAKAPAVTAQPSVNDGIDRAFEELNANGIVAMQGVGYTMSDGWADVNEVATARRPVPRGATFFHQQDKKRARGGEGLMLAFGAYENDPSKSLAANKSIAREVCATLVRCGVQATWDGDVDSRIRIPPFEWRKSTRRKA